MNGMKILGGILHQGEREAQRRFGAMREGEAMSRIVRDRISPALARFLEAQPFCFIATADNRGECDCSFRGRQHNLPHSPDPLLKVVDEKTLVFPDYSGNKLYNSLGNILVNPHIGMLFVDFRTGVRVRINGRAEIIENPQAFQEAWPDALRYVQVAVAQAYPNCNARVPKMALAQ